MSEFVQEAYLFPMDIKQYLSSPRVNYVIAIMNGGISSYLSA